MERRMIGLPGGYRDVYFAEAARRRAAEEKLAALFAASGYREVAPSAVEFYELYERGHQSARQRAIRFLDRDDRLLALRADFTPAVARLVAGPLAQEPLPLRLWYAGTVFRKTENHRGAFCETPQIGIELIGESSPAADAEALSLLLRSCDLLGAQRVSLHLNHAGIFRGILRELRLSAGAIRGLKAEIDRKDVRGLADRLASLGVPDDLQRQVRKLSALVGPAPVLDEALAILTNDESRAGVERLREVLRLLGPVAETVTFDLAEMDDLEYYTGVMCSVILPGQNRLAGKGGRYDSLLREFGREAPAIGFTLSLDTLTEPV